MARNFIYQKPAKYWKSVQIIRLFWFLKVQSHVNEYMLLKLYECSQLKGLNFVLCKFRVWSKTEMQYALSYLLFYEY